MNKKTQKEILETVSMRKNNSTMSDDDDDDVNVKTLKITNRGKGRDDGLCLKLYKLHLATPSCTSE